MSRLSGAAAVAGVMGWPVGHSLSPRIHGTWLERHGIDGAYIPMPVRPESLETALRALPVLGMRGANLTLPLKEKAVSLVDRLDPAAARIGAVNTVIVGSDGLLEGRNTDAFGFRESLRDAMPSIAGRRAVVLGAGGAARAVLHAVLAEEAEAVTVVNRTRDRGEALREDFGDRVATATWEQAGTLLAETDLLVNTTSLGMKGQPPLELSLDALPDHAVVCDIVYVPLLTGLLQSAQARRLTTVDGLGMLLHQARPGFEAWFGVSPRVDDDLRIRIGVGDGAAGNGKNGACE